MRPGRNAWMALALMLLIVSPIRADQEPKPSANFEKHKRGNYTLELPGVSARSYLQIQAELGQRPNPDMLQRARRDPAYLIPREDGKPSSFRIIVPDSYRPGVPHGILVFISSNDRGQFPRQYHKLLNTHHLISISPINSGNSQDTIRRHAYAVQAAELIQELYDVDEDRVYITGGSGGGRVTSQIMIMRSDLFDGGAPLVGANAMIPMETADSDGNTYQTRGSWRKPDRRRLMQAKVHGRYAFVTGSDDYNRLNVKYVHDGYQKNGFRHLIYIEEPGLGHTVPGPDSLEKAIVFMDSPLAKEAADHFKIAQQQDQAGRLGRALEMYRKAMMHGRSQDFYETARQRNDELTEEFNTAMQQVEDAIEAKDRAAFQTHLNELRRQWRKVLDPQLPRELSNRLRQEMAGNP